MQLTRQIQHWGNSAGIRLPKKVIEQARLVPGQMVAIDLRGSSIVLTPLRDEEPVLPKLADLLKGVTPDKVGGEIDWGPDRGRERLDG